MNRPEKIYSPWRFIRKLFLTILIVLLFVLFLVWRVDNPRLEQMRFTIMDNYLPDLDVLYKPFSGVVTLMRNYRGYEDLARENRELRRRLQQMERWKESALQLEQINAELRALNNLSVTPQASFISGEVISDSGSVYSQTALINIGKNKGVYIGAPVLDGFGLVGRVIGVGEDKARILLLSDPTNQVSALVMPNRIRAIVRGANSTELDIIPVDSGAKVLAGSRVVTSGEGIFPADLLIGYLTIKDDEELSVRLAADYSALEFARVLIAEDKIEVPDFEGVLRRQSAAETSDISAEGSEEGDE